MRIIALLSFLFVSTFVNAQVTEGKIIFKSEHQIQIDSSRLARMPEERKEKMMKRMKSWGKGKSVLLFNLNESLYRNFSSDKDTLDSDSLKTVSTERGHWRMMNPEFFVYQNIDKKMIVEQKDMFDKKFLIDRKFNDITWKLTGKPSTILGYRCQEAIGLSSDSTKIIAYFTPMIPVSSGPNGNTGLPGMILELDVNNGEYTYQAIQVNKRSILDGGIFKPTKGKKATQEEFDAIMKAKMKEMREMGGGQRMGH